MLGIFCTAAFSNNEEYKQHLKKRNRAMAGVSVLGLLTFVIGIAANFVWNAAVPEYMLGFYSGLGIGLMIGGVTVIVKNTRKMKTEETLRKNRIEAADERNVEIRNAAMKTALSILLAGMYLFMLIGGLWYPVLVKILLALVLLFLFSYVVSYRIFSKKM